MEQRSFQIRKVDEANRTVEGIAVPFDSVVDLGSYKESFARGSIAGVEGVKLFWNHSEAIGKVVRGTDTEEGYEIVAKISDVPQGNIAYTLLRDGVIDKFSVGFVPVESREDEDVTVRTKVELKEVSLVPFPAYAGASVTMVRNAAGDADNNNEKEQEMTDTTIASQVSEFRAAVEEVNSKIDDVDRKVSLMGSPVQAVTRSESKFRTGGEFLKALASGDADAKMEARANLTFGGFTADTNPKPAWANRLTELATVNRDILNLFTKQPHPGTTSVTLPVLGATTGTGTTATAGIQGVEGTDLAAVKIAFVDATYNNKTFGNYAPVTRQAIELGTPGYLQKVLEFQANEYAKDTNAEVRRALVGATGTPTATLSADTYVGWADFVVDSATALATNGSGVSAEFMVVSSNVFKRLAKLVDSAGRPLMVVNNDGVNTVGRVNHLGLSGNLLGLEVIVDPAAALNTCYVLNSQAITVMESAGAPYSLNDDNIINLTKDFSVYGYLIVGVTNKLAIVKGDVDLV